MNSVNFAEKFDDYLNPILVKEMRRLLRGYSFFVAFTLYFILIAGITIFGLIHPEQLSTIDLCQYIFALLGIFCLFVIPISIEDIIKKNIKSDTDELVSISTLPYSDVVNGYFLLGFIQVTALYAASLPFAIIPTFIGSIDLQKIFILMTISYFPCLMVITWIVQNTLLIKQKPGMKAIIDLVSGAGIWLVAGPMIFVFKQALRDKILNSISETALWVIIEIGLLIVFYKIIVFTNPQNIETPKKVLTFRVYMTIILAIAIISSFIFNSYAEIAFAVIILFLLGSSIFIHCEPEGYSERFVNEMPSEPFAKLIKFPFQRGVVNGLSWLAIVTIFTFIAFTIITEVFSLYTYIIKNPGLLLLASIATINAYLFFGNFIRKIFFKKHKKGTNIVIALILFICIGCIPAHILSREDRIKIGYNTYITKYDGPFTPKIYPLPVGFLNPIAVGLHSKDSSGKTIILSSLLLGLGVLLNIRSLCKQTTDYFTETPYEEEEQ